MTAVPSAEAPITDDDATIARMLRDADAPTLLMTVMHLSGETGTHALLDGPLRPSAVVPRMPWAPRMSEADADRVRALALPLLCAHRDGRPLPPPPGRDTVRRMMDRYMGERIPDEYVTMILEELALDGRDARAVHWDRPVPRAALDDCHVAIIGAGMSGLLAAARMKAMGLPFTVIEKNPEVGGTWYENTYPGCRVDVPNHFYSYAARPNAGWSEYFSQRDELFDYFRQYARSEGLTPHIRFGTEVTEARFIDGQWRIVLRSADGRSQVLTSRVLISAAGMLNRPHTPDLPGQPRFQGRSIHTARWDRDTPVQGQRFAVIGSAASAFQLVPELAKQAAHVTVFQRTPNWMAPRPNYHDPVDDATRWLLRHVPYYGRWYRFILFWSLADANLPALRADPAWPHPERAMNALNDEARQRLTAYITSQIQEDRHAELLPKLIPSYPPGGKRPLGDNGSWLRALQAPNVTLVTDGLREITEDAVIDATGRRHPVDTLVYATGFKAAEFLWPMTIVGEHGRSLADVWGDQPEAYLGITVPGFPNFFCLYGPGTNPGHGGSVIFQVECQVRYVAGCIKAMVEREARRIDCKPEVSAAFAQRQREALAQMVWAHPGVTSYYRNDAGVVVTNMPWRLIDYWAWTRDPDPADFTFA